MKWFLPIPAIIWFGLFLLFGDVYVVFGQEQGPLAFLFGLAVLGYYLSFTPLFDVFTQGGFYARFGTWVDHTSDAEQGCIAFLVRGGLLMAIYGMPIKTLL